MKQHLLILVLSLFAVNAMAEVIGFDQDQTDARIAGSGAAGVRTKADSMTAFDDFSWGGS